MMKRWLFLGLLLLWPALLFAQTSIQSSYGTLVFAPVPDDLSVIYLSNIFGSVGNFLFAAGGGGLTGALFGVYNSAILVLGGIVVMYTFLMGTIKTAHEGEVLGQSKEWSSIWTPLRTVAGIALLIPQSSGYSFIQIFVLWVIIQGVGVADSIWGTTLNYLYKGGIVIQQNYSGITSQSHTVTIDIPGWGTHSYTYSTNTPIDRGPMIDRAATLLQSLTCVEIFQLELQNYQQYQQQHGMTPLDPVPNFFQDIINAINTSPAGASPTIPFPTSHYYGTDGACGAVSWLPVTAGAPPAVLPMLAGNNDRALAVGYAVSILDGYARQIAQNYLSQTPSPLGQLVGQSWGSPSNSGTYLIPGSIIGDAATAYYGKMSSTVRLLSESANDLATLSAFTTEAKKPGWIMAGAYYFNIVAANNKIANIIDNNPPTVALPSSNLSTEPRITNYLGGANSIYVSQMQGLINGGNQNENNDYIVASNARFIPDAKSYAGSLSYGSTNLGATGTNVTSGGASGQMLGPVNSLSTTAANWLSQLGNAQATNQNPVVAIAGFGSSLVGAAFNNIIMMAGIGFGITFALGLMPFDSLGAAGVSIVTSIMSFFTPIYVAILVAGLTMAYYIPMIPFIIFSFGAIGWLIAVIEAMLAAPMVALGIAHPEGSHAVLGKAEPAVGLLVNVFMRPTFMIFGLLFGMMISYVGIWLLNRGFGLAFNGATSGLPSAGGGTGLFEPLACVIIYVLIAMQIVQKSFTLIYTIPDHVMRWIGINVQGLGGEADVEKAISEGVHGAFSKAGEHTGAIVDTALKVGENAGVMTKEIAKMIATRGKGGGARAGAAGKGAKGAKASGKSTGAQGAQGKHGQHGAQAKGTGSSSGGGTHNQQTTIQQNIQNQMQNQGGGGGGGGAPDAASIRKMMDEIITMMRHAQQAGGGMG